LLKRANSTSWLIRRPCWCFGWHHSSGASFCGDSIQTPVFSSAPLLIPFAPLIFLRNCFSRFTPLNRMLMDPETWSRTCVGRLFKGSQLIDSPSHVCRNPSWSFGSYVWGRAHIFIRSGCTVGNTMPPNVRRPPLFSMYRLTRRAQIHVLQHVSGALSSVQQTVTNPF
jgi:hypothetical protein